MASDVNGDGFGDLIVGTGGAHEFAGDSYVVFGGDFAGYVTHFRSAAADLLTGTAGDEVMVGGLGADTLDGGAGGSDAFSGGKGNDLIILETSVDDTRTLRHARCAGCSGRTEAHSLGDPKKFRSC